MLRPLALRSLASVGTIAVGVLMASSGLAQEMPGNGVTVQPIKSPPMNSWLWHQVVNLGLEELGYEVAEMREADFPVLHLAVGQGDADYTANNWKPLHDAFYEKAGGEKTMVRAGPITSNAGQGYYVDKATADKYGITNLAQLTDPKIAALFDTDGDGLANLAGCNPGWGCEAVIEHQLDAFGLRDTVEHDQGSYSAIIADTVARYRNGEPILYYTWSPNWVGDILVPGEDTTQLSVPFSAMPNDPDADTEQENGFNPGFAVNDVYILANREFYENNPAAATFFEHVKIPLNDVNAAQLAIYNGADSDSDLLNQARAWVAYHRETFDEWLEAAREAARD
ncbi:glycine betaine/L-proline ABC transporter substrate-binding protein ProX [Afifella sp. IM 167]|uniref:glycine betaine/L-proline ABC transporter substrate-binding protein ProX n=1 Tax=Afifella sp. IM 167 TaxID=2033586 RepID=UPI001CCB93E6|nr:glycine betaine/L-proline ABC transporter substrate-binding protein ProX [Afifella sp. IM 167]MBZ8135034.1 proline/glycine betaine ABC transporter substrate-binding protein ProX [Afifella sp. IM 167]